MAQTITQKPGHRNGFANPGPCRGCPECTGLSWAELHDREADAEMNRQDAIREAEYGMREWRQR